MKNKTIIGVDLGGTNMRAGRIENGVLVNVSSKPVPKTDNSNEVLDLLIDTITSVLNSDVVAIGIGVPGILDKNTGVIFDLVNIPSWKEIALKEELESHFNLPIFLDNDANCFARGENIFGKAQDVKNVVGLTLGTGMGAGVIINGALHSGLMCGAGELGELPYLNANYEKYCSGQYFRDINNTTGEIEYNKAEKGDFAAIEMFENYASHLAKAIEMVILTYAPDKIVLGGSVAKSKKYFEKNLLTFINKNNWRNLPKIEYSELENSAIFGAASLCF
ncbi:MAG: ROK family protein [Flavobacteriales bacterium]|nr:ROK family protein [Flavobacteriales bacterium]